MQTFDGMLHKMNIIDSESHQIVEKKNHLLFVIDNSGRNYVLSNNNCKVIDYDLLDRVMKCVRVDTGKF
jgi:hypothetical protein